MLKIRFYVMKKAQLDLDIFIWQMQWKIQVLVTWQGVALSLWCTIPIEVSSQLSVRSSTNQPTTIWLYPDATMLSSLLAYNINSELECTFSRWLFISLLKASCRSGRLWADKIWLLIIAGNQRSLLWVWVCVCRQAWCTDIVFFFRVRLSGLRSYNVQLKTGVKKTLHVCCRKKWIRKWLVRLVSP